MTTELTIKVQTWGDDLRLPCFINPATTAGLIAELDPLYQPSIPFQSKHLPALKRNKWFVLKRPVDRARTGMVVIWPSPGPSGGNTREACCVYISGDPLNNKRPSPRTALLRLRVDPQFLAPGAGLTVFAATLSPATRGIWIEDTLMWKGRQLLETESFSARYAMAVQWIEHYCIMDPRLIGGLTIEMAKWHPLGLLRPEGIWDLMGDVSSRRLLWIANYSDTVDPPPSNPVVLAPILEPVMGPTFAIATRDSGPEQWVLTSTADGSSMGRALIRTLAASERMRALSSLSSVASLSGSKGVRVEVTWNEVFKKWEIQ